MGKLIIVPTPLGNLEDITIRALQVLRDVNMIIAEDTRKTAILLKRYDISKKMLSFHKFNEHGEVNKIIRFLQSGETLALVSSAGTPAISDPGYLLVRQCVDNEIPVECLPGPTALIPALVNSAMPSDRFCFEGFLPHKKGRQKRLKELEQENRTMIFYESPFRVLKTLMQFSQVFGKDRNASVSRELTKIYEETKRGTLDELIHHFNAVTPKGEMVIVVEGKKAEKFEVFRDTIKGASKNNKM